MSVLRSLGRGQEFKGTLRLQSKSEASLGYIRPCFKKTRWREASLGYIKPASKNKTGVLVVWGSLLWYTGE